MDVGKSSRAPLSSISADGAPPDPRRWKALAVLCAATFIIILDGSIVFVAVPSMAQDLKLTPTAIQWVLSSYLLSFGGLLLLGGRMADLLGRRRMFIVGGALLAVSSLFCGLAWNGDVLITFRVVQGVAAAIMTPTALSILMNTFREGKERNRALGAWSSAGGVGGTVGSLLGGPLTDGPGWGWIFFVNVPVALIMVALAPLVLRESYDKSRARTFDVAGALTSTAAMVILVYAIVDAPTAGWSSGKTIWKLVSAAILLGVFTLIERRSTSPLLPLRYFGVKGFVGGNLVLLLLGMAVQGGMGFTLTQYSQAVLGYSAVQFGLMFAVMTVLTIIGSTLAGGPLVLRFGPRPVAIAGLLLVGAACVSLTQLSFPGTFAGDMLLGMILFGPGLGAGFVAASIAALTGVPERDSGIASGVSNAAFHVGGALGIAIMAVVALSNAKGAIPPVAITHGFSVAFGVAIGFAGLGILVSLFLLGRPKKAVAGSASSTPAEPDHRAAA
jgi:EmrB/QacA subfamily drug resistance transporter